MVALNTRPTSRASGERFRWKLPVFRLGHCCEGTATVELSVLLPFLAFLFVAGLDYSRVFYTSVIVSNCARNGALFASDFTMADQSPYETLEQAVYADATDLTGEFEITSQEGKDAQGYGWVEVTVVYPFETVVTYPGIPSEVNIKRTVRMRKLPQNES